MTKLSVYSAASLICLGAASTALGADLPGKKGPPLAPPPPIFSWQGGYIGVYAGALLGEGSFKIVTETPQRGAAFVGGGTLGYNWQWTDQIVLGAEADFGYRGALSIESVGFVAPGPAQAGILGTARGRVGYAFAPRWLAYATAGLAFGTDFVPSSFTSTFPRAIATSSPGTTVRPGWTAGAGFEYAWSDNISVKGEYLYTWLANSGVNYSPVVGPSPLATEVRSAGHVVRGGLNYHFSFGAPPAAAPISAAPLITK